MSKETMTRREVIKLLGIKLPVVLLAVEILPGIARAGQSFTKKTFRAATTSRSETLDLFDASGEKMLVTAEYNENQEAIGTRITELSDSAAEKSHLTSGSVIYKVNDKPFIIESQEDFDNWRDSIISRIQNKQAFTLDLDVDAKPYLYTFEFV